MNIFSNFIPDKLVTFDDRDPLKLKNQLHNTYIKNGDKDNGYDMLQEAIYEVSEIINKRKEEYYYNLALKWNNPSTSRKTYWSILKTLYNGKKVPLTSQLQLGKHRFT